jgi:peptide-methionine (R)-S-oxide reductase
MNRYPTSDVVRSALVVSLCLLLFPTVDGFNVIHGFVGSAKKGPLILLRMSEEDPIATTTAATTEDGPLFPIEKTDDEWKELLTPDQYYILRKEGTETPGASALNQISIEKNGSEDFGTFCCAGCGNPLFLASTKFESGSGWPSFYQPLSSSAVGLQTDYKMVVPRTECVCNRCGGHLGHVFEGTHRKLVYKQIYIIIINQLEQHLQRVLQDGKTNWYSRATNASNGGRMLEDGTTNEPLGG